MRDLALLDIYRIAGELGGDGAFLVPSPIDRYPLRVIASTGLGWDHVSVSRETRCPNWPEMECVRLLFFRENETVMQLHVPTSEHVNNHPYCLHLWRPLNAEIPRPPSILVGDASLGDLTEAGR